ncbi:insulin-induced protein-domain-containing protein [Gamsiella multidivaricata]|uniref:insulin-induced protein-domain-containing protein n=1 Tax=Gamsiella multidivaricata TaxID=101098 RepID=UPI00221FEC75|nr:insulin-induced protein-domain-containing protein [Gamsiella multidivaricata]KAI7819614.1 insulin-induced protein-domain-containing protein [Gamsiella multidivaricata]
MTESRAFAAMVSSPTKGGLTSAPSKSASSFRFPTSLPTTTSSSPSASLDTHASPSTFQQLLSYLPFLSSSSSSRSTPSINSSRPHTSSRPCCSARTCLSYCCSTPETLKSFSHSGPSSTVNLRPKNYYSKRQRFISSSQHAHSMFLPTSSASHSDSGSDRDELQQLDSSFESLQRHSPLYRRSRSASTNNSATITTTTITTTTTTTARPRSSTHSMAPSPDLSPAETNTTIPGNKSRRPALGLVADGPYLFLFDVALSLYYPIRALILFVLGFVFSLIIDHLQTQHQLVEYPSNVPHLWDTASWLPPTCGASAVLIGTIYPLGDYLWWGRRVRRNGRDWSSVMRCLGGFIGVNYAASKLPMTSSLQVSCTLALISVALWFLFDRTVHGFVISLTVASMGTTVAYFLVLNGWYRYVLFIACLWFFIIMIRISFVLRGEHFFYFILCCIPRACNDQGGPSKTGSWMHFFFSILECVSRELRCHGSLVRFLEDYIKKKEYCLGVDN